MTRNDYYLRARTTQRRIVTSAIIDVIGRNWRKFVVATVLLYPGTFIVQIEVKSN